MYKIYLTCLIVSLLLLVISFVATGLSDLFQGISSFDFDGLDFHTDLISGFLPLSPLELCAFAIAFGGMGLIFYDMTSFHLPIAIFSGFVMSWIIKWILHYLKRVDSSTLTDLDLIGMYGTVVVTILKNSRGSVSLDTKVGKITYTAKSTTTIPQGTTIKVIDVVHHTLVVSDDLDAPLLTKESTLEI